MRPIRSLLTVAGLAAAMTLSIGAAPAFAHHAPGLYDTTPAKSTEITGAVEKFEWSNPHSWLFVKVAKPDGTSVVYGFEMTSPGEMLRRGWKKNSVKPGDSVKVRFAPMRDGRPAGLARGVTFADGKPIGNPPQGAPQGGLGGAPGVN